MSKHQPSFLGKRDVRSRARSTVAMRCLSTGVSVCGRDTHQRRQTYELAHHGQRLSWEARHSAASPSRIGLLRVRRELAAVSRGDKALAHDGHVAVLSTASLATLLEVRVELARAQVDGVRRRPAILVEPRCERVHLLAIVKHVLGHLPKARDGGEGAEGRVEARAPPPFKRAPRTGPCFVNMFPGTFVFETWPLNDSVVPARGLSSSGSIGPSARRSVYAGWMARCPDSAAGLPRVSFRFTLGCISFVKLSNPFSPSVSLSSSRNSAENSCSKRVLRRVRRVYSAPGHDASPLTVHCFTSGGNVRPLPLAMRPQQNSLPKLALRNFSLPNRV